ncbi:Peptidyl-prolyl isomerase cwc27 [Coemansia sp. RSA 1813]|nr:Peptidyl-prolyl isomerase cwc27 [Coemansia sp. RSA 1646]KAJ1773093.1 Peptidyl-prolyl isomerase cwc27 [Coemansia sp. RSA 1843]KAJ2086046.1 Peptidyl-prolyl isomerase cwc27 [Coemansia sp. RSA 986]KAJ2211166.1 Peptidyl-prolyl isomerase cwc27 [Coemansia sp. RSA 487]KAJ2572017.1 Peptidyl-prolyl isomerase cwc27 [Coemansia sp. RSA 1813]
MSNIYVSEPPTFGKVILETTVGNIEIELWSKEAPKACRNFLQLCMEGFYDNSIFHRIVPGWIVQGGDPSGTGEGGESIYGAPFADEFHSRLRFSRRGLVGMANSGPNENRSQFFITLAPTPELQKKNTLFATVVGDSLFNALKLGEGEVDKETERPVYTRKIIHARVLDNPFTDITIRTHLETSAANSGSVNINKLEARKGKIKTVKDKKLLSFADDEDDADIVTKVGNSGMKSSHDLLVSDSTLGHSSRKTPKHKDKANGHNEGASDTNHTTVGVLTDQGDDAQENGVVYVAKARKGKAVHKPKRSKAEGEDTRQLSGPDRLWTTAGSKDTDEANKRSTKRSGSKAASNVELIRGQYKPMGLSATKGRKNDSHEDELLARLGVFKSKIRKVREEDQKTR